VNIERNGWKVVYPFNNRHVDLGQHPVVLISTARV